MIGAEDIKKIEKKFGYDCIANFFYEGLARVSKDNKRFHINHNGKPAYKERYDDVGNFYEGLARVSIDNYSKGFHIDHNGKPAYEERYELVMDFYEGLARARKDTKFFHIDYNGKRIESSLKKS